MNNYLEHLDIICRFELYKIKTKQKTYARRKQK